MNSLKTIYFDGEGMDASFEIYLPAIIQFLNQNPEYNINLYIIESTAQKLQSSSFEIKNLKIIVCEELIKNEDSPLIFRKKINSTMMKCLTALKNHKGATTMICAGNSGAYVLAISMMLTKIASKFAGAYMAIFPTENNNPKLLLDLGTNLNPQLETMIAYAYQGKIFNEVYFGLKNSSVALLNNGKEAKKGLKLHQETYEALLADKEINFIGNIEAREILASDVNVIISDGWTANAALKSLEGTSLFLLDQIKKAISKANFFQKIAALIIKPVLKKVIKKYDYRNVGGSFILGFEKICIKAHGSSDTQTFYQTLLQAKNVIDLDLASKIKETYGH